MIDSTSFLMKVWSLQCEPGDYVCLSAKGSSWRDTLLPFNDKLEAAVTTWLETNKTKNLYFCPLPFNEPKRS